MSYTTHQRSNATKIVEVQAPFLHGEAKKVQAASLQDETMKQGGDVAAATGDLKTIREEYVAALPTMASFTGGEGVLEEVTLILSFLHGSDSDAAVFNEAATGEVVDRCAETGAKIITQIMRDHSEMLTPALVCKTGVVYLEACRSSSFTHRRDGKLKWRVLAAYADAIRSLMAGRILVAPSPDAEFTHEVVIPSYMFPASVLEQIYKQTRLCAAMHKDCGYARAVVYRVVCTPEDLDRNMARPKGFVVVLGTLVVNFRPVHSGLGYSRTCAAETVAPTRSEPPPCAVAEGSVGAQRGMGFPVGSDGARGTLVALQPHVEGPALEALVQGRGTWMPAVANDVLPLPPAPSPRPERPVQTLACCPRGRTGSFEIPPCCLQGGTGSAELPEPPPEPVPPASRRRRRRPPRLARCLRHQPLQP